MPPDRVTVIPNGVASWPEQDGIAVRDELGLEPDARVLVQTAVLRAQKAVDVMLEAVAILHRSEPSVRLLVIGQGDPGPLRELAGRLEIGHAVMFLGHRGDVPAVLAAADVGVLSSDFEGSPLAVLEYMAAGLPVVATDVGGVPSMVRRGETGLLVPRRDPAALAAAIRDVLADPDRMRTMGEQGRARHRAEFSNDTMGERVYELYERLLARKAGSARLAA
jgi:glycosyltransferase involved in cell wall biosynthesis